MSWMKFNDSFNNIKGQISNFAANVLADDNTEIDNVPETLDELQKLCAGQYQEIARLRELNEELLSKQNNESSVLPQNDSNWSWNESPQEFAPVSKNPNETDEIIADLKRKITILENEKRELLSNLELLDSDFQQNTEKLATMKDNLQVDYNDLEEKYMNLKDSYKTLTDEHAKLQSELKSSRKIDHSEEIPLEKCLKCEEYELVLEERNTLKNDISVLKKNVDTLEKQRLQLQNTNAKELKALQQKLTLSESENRILVAEMKKLSQSVLEFEERHKNDTENCEKVAAILDGYELEVSALKSALQNAEEAQKNNSGDELKRILDEQQQIHTKYIRILTENMKKYIDNDDSIQVDIAETDTNILEFRHQVENLMQIMRSLQSKCELLETDLYNAKREKTELLNEKNHEIEKLLQNSEILSQEVITKSQTIKDYEHEYNELIKNNDMLISELNEYKKNSGLQTISESNEDNLLLLESQLENANKRIKELETNVTEDNGGVLKKCHAENSDLKASLEQLKNDLENIEYQYTEVNVNTESMKEEVEIQKKKIEELVGHNFALEKSNTELERNAENTRGELNMLREKMIFDEDTRKLLENQIRNLTEKLQNAKMSETSLKLQYDTLTKELVACNETKTSLEANFTELNRTLADNEETIKALREENDSLQEQLKSKEAPDSGNFEAEVAQLKKELDELTASKQDLANMLIAKHQENVTYHNEIQRLSQLLTVELSKSSNMEQLDALKDQNEFLRQKCEVLADNLLKEQSKVQQVLSERSTLIEKEKEVLGKKLERLQAHLIEMEEHYTQELLKAEEKNAVLQTKVNEIEQREKNSSTMYTSVSIRANQHVETLQHQLQLITNQRDELRKKMSDAEDHACKQATALATLQSVLEQFQREKENDVFKETERLRRQIVTEKKVQDELKSEIANLNSQLAETKHGLLAASRLSDQLESSKQLIASLKTEVSQLREQLTKNEEKMNSMTGQTDGKVDKSLIKNLVIGLVTTNKNLNKDQLQIMKIIATVLDFNQQDHEKMDLSKPQQGWLGSLLSPQTTQGMSQESLSQAFVKFLESESTPRLVPSLLSQEQEDPKSRKTSVVRQSPIVLSEVVLPTFADFAQNRNSSSILKDILKDNS